MAPQAESVDTDREKGDENATPLITAHETVPERLVFTEDDNTDGWIATDLTVDVSE